MNSSVLRRGGALAILAAGLSGCVAYYPEDPYYAGPAYGPPAVAYGPPAVYAPPVYGSVNLNLGGRGYGHGYRRGWYGRPYGRYWR